MNHYQTLGVRQTASKDDIKRAYHKLALKYHPDKNTSKNAGDKFRAVNEAYEILIDEQKRAIYDRFELPAKNDQSSATSGSSRSRNTNYKTPSRYDDSFFTGSASEGAREEKRHQEKLDQIRRINTDLLDEANARLRRSRGSQKSGSGATSGSTQSKVFTGQILPNEDDDSYEKIVLKRLRELASCS